MAEVLVEAFDGDELDLDRWLPAYLPAWASLAENAARWRMTGSSLVLTVEPDQGDWCSATHPTRLRTSAIASGDWSGPVGSNRGPQPFLSYQRVREQRPRFTGWLVDGGFVEIRCRMSLSSRSMAALWLAGWDEEDAADSGELCVVEVFGDAVSGGESPSAAVGVGIKAKTDPRLSDDFAAPRLPIDIGGWHTYRVDWDEREARFAVDGETVRACIGPPGYPMLLMLGVFDFPDQPGPADHVPWLEVATISGTRS